MWWSIPSLPPTMRPMEGFDYILFTINPILPIIGLSGMVVLAISIAIFFIDRK